MDPAPPQQSGLPLPPLCIYRANACIHVVCVCEDTEGRKVLECGMREFVCVCTIYRPTLRHVKREAGRASSKERGWKRIC